MSPLLLHLEFCRMLEHIPFYLEKNLVAQNYGIMTRVLSCVREEEVEYCFA